MQRQPKSVTQLFLTSMMTGGSKTHYKNSAQSKNHMLTTLKAFITLLSWVGDRKNIFSHGDNSVRRKGRFAYPSQSHAGDCRSAATVYKENSGASVFFKKPFSFLPPLGTIEFIGSGIYCHLLVLTWLRRACNGSTTIAFYHPRKQSLPFFFNTLCCGQARSTSKQRMPGVVVLRQLRPGNSYGAL